MFVNIGKRRETNRRINAPCPPAHLVCADVRDQFLFIPHLHRRTLTCMTPFSILEILPTQELPVRAQPGRVPTLSQKRSRPWSRASERRGESGARAQSLASLESFSRGGVCGALPRIQEVGWYERAGGGYTCRTRSVRESPSATAETLRLTSLGDC